MPCTFAIVGARAETLGTLIRFDLPAPVRTSPALVGTGLPVIAETDADPPGSCTVFTADSSPLTSSASGSVSGACSVFSPRSQIVVPPAGIGIPVLTAIIDPHFAPAAFTT